MANPISLSVGEQAKLNVNITPSGTGPVGGVQGLASWTTSNVGIAAFIQYEQELASVTGSSVFVQGIAAGTATVTLSLGSLTDTIVITVSANPEVNVASVSIGVGPG
jgi:hypothetical protein